MFSCGLYFCMPTTSAGEYNTIIIYGMVGWTTRNRLRRWPGFCACEYFQFFVLKKKKNPEKGGTLFNLERPVSFLL